MNLGDAPVCWLGRFVAVLGITQAGILRICTRAEVASRVGIMLIVEERAGLTVFTGARHSRIARAGMLAVLRYPATGLKVRTLVGWSVILL